MTNPQSEFSFDHSSPANRLDGLECWRSEFDATQRELATKLGLPLNRHVEVWLRDGLRLRGTLHLRERRLIVIDEEKYQLELEVDHVTFRHSEIESCVVVD